MNGEDGFFGFMIAIVISFLAFGSCAVGKDSGRNEVRHEAVITGHAYEAYNDGELEFNWTATCAPDTLDCN